MTETKKTKSKAPKARRPYERPAFMPSMAFERQALACTGCLLASAAPPSFCAFNS